MCNTCTQFYSVHERLIHINIWLNFDIILRIKYLIIFIFLGTPGTLWFKVQCLLFRVFSRKDERTPVVNDYRLGTDLGSQGLRIGRQLNQVMCKVLEFNVTYRRKLLSDLFKKSLCCSHSETTHLLSLLLCVNFRGLLLKDVTGVFSRRTFGTESTICDL